MKNDPALERCLGGVGGSVQEWGGGKPSQFAHTSDHRTPSVLGEVERGWLPTPRVPLPGLRNRHRSNSLGILSKGESSSSQQDQKRFRVGS